MDSDSVAAPKGIEYGNGVNAEVARENAACATKGVRTGGMDNATGHGDGGAKAGEMREVSALQQISEQAAGFPDNEPMDVLDNQNVGYHKERAPHQ